MKTSRQDRRLSWKFKRSMEPYLFILPAAIFVIWLFAYPVCRTFYMSFFQYHPLKHTLIFRGFYNYIKVFTSEYLFFNSLKVTLIYTIGSVLGVMLFGLAVALLLNTEVKGKAIFRTGFLIPNFIPGITVAFTWIWIFEPRLGLINDLLLRMGKEPILWFVSARLGMTAVIIAHIWCAGPFAALILLGGLASIPEQLHEAAEIDGATTLNKFIYVTLPLLRPVIIIAILLQTIWTFNSFDLMYIMTKGGPARATELLSLWVYREAAENYRFGRASAVAVVMSLISTVFVLFYLYMLKRTGEKI